MKPESLRLLNKIQMVSEVGIGAGYLLGFIPFLYSWAAGWVVPLVFVSLIIALINHNGTLKLTIANVALAFLSWIPIVGYLFRAVGLVVSYYNLRTLNRR